MKDDKIPVVILLTAIVFFTNIVQIHSESANNATDVSLTGDQPTEQKCNTEGNQCQSNAKAEKLLSRRKRYVAFPEGSSFSVNILPSQFVAHYIYIIYLFC